MSLHFWGFYSLRIFLFLFWWFCNTFSNPRTLIALEFNFNFRFLERLAINVNKDIEKVFICFAGVFNFFNVIPISVVQNIFKTCQYLFTVRAFVGRIYDWSLCCFIGFKCEDNGKIIWQVSFYYGWLKVTVACNTVGDNVVYGICWESGYPCWFICLRNHIIAKYEIEKALHVFICFNI